jgi:hypothetical protein
MDKVETAYGVVTHVGTLFVSSTTSQTVTGSTVSNPETLFNQNTTIPANAMIAGSTLRLKAFGAYNTDSTVVAQGLTLEFKVKLGSTIVIDSGALTPANNAANKQWEMEGLFVITSAGSGGTLNGAGDIGINNGAFAGTFTSLASSGVAINTTISNVLGISVQWAATNTTPNTNDTITLKFIVIEVLQ